MRSNPGCPGPCRDITDYQVTWRSFEVHEPRPMNQRIRFQAAIRNVTSLSFRQYYRSLGLIISRHFQFDDELDHPPPQCLGFLSRTQLPRGWEFEFDYYEDEGLGRSIYHIDIVPVIRYLEL